VNRWTRALSRETASHTMWPRSFAIVLLALVLVHQCLMTASFAGVHVDPAGTTAHLDAFACPSHGPVSMQPCPVVTATLPRVTLAPMLLVLLVLLGVLRLIHAQSGRCEEWHWPPRRRRALLQVYRC